MQIRDDAHGIREARALNANDYINKPVHVTMTHTMTHTMAHTMAHTAYGGRLNKY